MLNLETTSIGVLTYGRFNFGNQVPDELLEFQE